MNPSSKWLLLPKKRQLDLLLQLCRTLETKDTLSKDEPEFQKLEKKIDSFKNHEDLDLSRLFSLHNRLFKKTNKINLQNFIISLERLCNIDTLETDFLITTTDGTSSTQRKAPLFVVLENIRSSFNVGSLFRSADCLGVTKIFLVGYSPTPDQIKTKKTSLGADTHVDWQHYESLEEALDELSSKNIPCYALETSTESENIFDVRFPSSVALLLGNERFGLSPHALSSSQKRLQIPTYGFKNSLNVSHAMAITGYEICRQWNLK